MKERPILFSAPMVRAILAGTKTQTRRICRGQRELSCAHDFQLDRCPYGVPGDRLWVREAWAVPHALDGRKPRYIPQDARFHYAATEDRGGLLWRTSIHMPRWASRITLEVTEVRVERLQYISEADARAEGVTPADCCDAHYHGFRLLWESINGPGAWDANPWVWVVQFRKAGGEG